MTVYRGMKRYQNAGIAPIHRDTPDHAYEGKPDKGDEPRLIALACEEPPDGRTRWTLRLLADEFVGLESVELDSISPETVRKPSIKRTTDSPIQTLGDTAGGAASLSNNSRVCSRSPRIIRAGSSRRVYQRTPTQLIGHVHERQPTKADRVGSEDYHYKRVDMKNTFLDSEPLDG